MPSRLTASEVTQKFVLLRPCQVLLYAQWLNFEARLVSVIVLQASLIAA
jgi:hypothetical protein